MAAHLEKVLKHAEDKLMLSARDRPVDQVDLYRHFLKIEGHRLLMAHRAGEGGWDLARKHSDLYTVVLRHIFDQALDNAERSHTVTRREAPIAMLAVGGFGRGELCPHSDIDLLFLFAPLKPKSPAAKFCHDVVEQVLYLLWDIGLKVGHASRSVDEALAQACEDLQTLTAMMDARLIDGDGDLFFQFESKFSKTCLRSRKNEYLIWRLNDQRDRHAKYDGTVFVQEPHVKNGCGGLRDFQNMLWVARMSEGIESLNQLHKQGWIKAPQRKRLYEAHDFLLRVRNQLHYDAGRASEILTLRAQGEVATGLHYTHKSILRRTEALMRDYYRHSQEIYHTCNLISRHMAGEGQDRPHFMESLVPKRMRRTEEVHGFTLRNGMLTVPSTRFFSADPVRIVRAFQIMQQRNAVLAPETESRIANRARLLTRQELRGNPEYREILFHLLRQKGQVGRIARAMHRNGVLGRLIPEFAPLTCLVQHEFYHRYTADEHTLVCLEQLDQVLDSKESPYKDYRVLFERCDQPDLLYLALILHDVGKADNTGNHQAAGVQKAVRFGRRMGIKGPRLQTLSFLVDHHATFNEFACRRNLEDPKTISDFAHIVQDRERLELLMLMSFADTRGTGDQSWSNWKEGLVWHLFRLTAAMLKDRAEFQKMQEREQAEVRTSVMQQIDSEMSEEEAEAHFDALPAYYLNYRNQPLILQQMLATHRFILRQTLAAEPAEVLRPEIHWENRPLVDCSEISVVTWDRRQLFSKICGAFTVTGLEIMSADIWTRSDNIAIDTFRVCTEKQTDASHPRDRERFEEILSRSLLEEDFDLRAEVVRFGKSRRRAPVDEDILQPALGIDNESSDSQTVLHVRASDRMGLLFIIASCIADLGHSIVNARVSTEKGAALDAFYLVNPEGQKITEKADQVKLLRRLNAAIVDFIS